MSGFGGLPQLLYPLLPELPWVLLDPLMAPIDSCEADLGMVVGVLGTILSLTLLL